MLVETQNGALHPHQGGHGIQGWGRDIQLARQFQNR